jgi:uncharacterized SAM-binding protein YcdF (DUF218 family)
MLTNRNIICISSIDWDFIWQGHQEIMSTFAKNGNRVLFIENTGVRAPRLKDVQRLKKRVINWVRSVRGFRQEMENLYIYSPLMLPFPFSRVAALVNRLLFIRPVLRWMKLMKFSDPIIWTFLPTGTALDIIDKIDGKLLVYYCIADFNELVKDPKKIMKTGEELVKKCDVIFAQGEVLKKRCEEFNRNVHIFPFGVKMEVFSGLNGAAAGVPEDMKGIKKPVIGYVGGIHRHIDFNLIKKISSAHPEWSVVMVGPVQTDVSCLEGLKNVFLLGKKDFSMLPGYVKEFDVCIIPYEVSGYTETVFPTKLNEYHAMGKPVVSTALPEVVGFNSRNGNIVGIGRTEDEFVARIEDAMGNKDDRLAGLRMESAENNSWTSRIEKMSGIIEEAIALKAKGPADWRESFRRIYNVSRKKALKAIAALSAGYLLIFHTPLIWIMAGPLKISQPPAVSDCVAVFGGGVGESGKAGQGYEERVGYAVELYKKGYSKNLIFSSGYKSFYNETLLMKALAMELGIPDSAIMLETDAANVYENVKFTKKILEERGWRSVMVVSSPYNMRRISLVFGKLGRNIGVKYTPLPNSSFYSHASGGVFDRQINIRQIRGILHEYIGIVYYWLKGWI